MGRLILVRHGESEGNRDRRFTQSPEVGLTDLGRSQARDAALVIQREFAAELVVSSPFTRARVTAEIIGETLALPIEIEDDLREQCFGALAGQSYDALVSDASFHQGPRWEWRPPDGESLVDVYQRVTPVLDRLAHVHEGRDIVVVSHGGVMFALGAYVSGSWETSLIPPNCGIVVVPHRAGQYGSLQQRP